MQTIDSSDDTLDTTYTYNPNGQRIKKTANGLTTWYLYNENGLAAEYTNSGQLIKEYQFHPQKTWMTDPLFQRTAAGDVYYYHNDHLGTPQQLLDEAGNIVWAAQYSAFGKAFITAGTVENNLRFPGQYLDPETGLYYNYFRDYDPSLGRYIESDPIGLRGGINTYAYVEGNPINKIDPTGQLAIVIFLPALAEVALGLGTAWQLNKNNHSDTDLQKEIEKNANYSQYKNRCNEKPPLGPMDECQRAQWELSKAKDCKALRQANTDKWWGGVDVEHDAQLAQDIENQLNRAQSAVDKKCKCPN